jgi:hypothetical protein
VAGSSSNGSFRCYCGALDFMSVPEDELAPDDGLEELEPCGLSGSFCVALPVSEDPPDRIVPLVELRLETEPVVSLDGWRWRPAETSRSRDWTLVRDCTLLRRCSSEMPAFTPTSLERRMVVRRLTATLGSLVS